MKLQKVICKVIYSVHGEIFMEWITLFVDKIENKEIRYQCREQILKINNHGLIMKIEINIINAFYTITE
jgi:hypothetical protein